MAFLSDVTFVLHAGAYKTATSTIQTLMMQHREEIVRRYGLLYPVTGARRNTGSGNPDSMAHHLFFHLLRDDGSPPDPEKILAQKTRLADEVAAAGVKTVVLCSELFTSAPLPVKRAFVEMLGGAALRVVYSVRRPDDYIESMLNQAHKNFRTPSNAAGRTLPITRNLEEWSNLLGRDALQVLVFSKSDYPGYLSRVFSALGVAGDDPLIDPALHDNPAMTLNGLLMRRMVSLRMKGRGTEINRSLRHRLNVELDTLETALPASPKAIFLTRRERKQAMQVGGAQTEAIAAFMASDEAEMFREEMRAPVATIRRNAGSELPMNAETLAAMCEGLVHGSLGKMLGY